MKEWKELLGLLADVVAYTIFYLLIFSVTLIFVALIWNKIIIVQIILLTLGMSIPNLIAIVIALKIIEKRIQ